MNREILFRGKRVDNEMWIYGDLLQSTDIVNCTEISENTGMGVRYDIIPETVGQYTGLTDKNGTKIFEGDILQYQTSNGFDCQSIVKFGIYNQDGSGGEYNCIKVLGFYVEVNNFTCPDWCENSPEKFPEYLYQQNINEVCEILEVIGNIYDNPELLNERDTNV